MKPEAFPIYINCRDRMTCARDLTTWLLNAGYIDIVLIDNDSTYPPMVEWLAEIEREVEVRVARIPNYGSRSIWQAYKHPDIGPGLLGYFVYTDPDLLPTEDCPADIVSHLYGLLQDFDHPKASAGLYLGDLPDTLDPGIVTWEHRLLEPWVGDNWLGELVPGVYDTMSDTTFAVYRPGESFTYESIRTGAPYLMRHKSWYISEPDEEDAYYLEHAISGSRGSSWKQKREEG